MATHICQQILTQEPSKGRNFAVKIQIL